MPLVCRHHPRPSRLPARTSPPASHALPPTRQEAKAFNKPLSFDTSSVTTMYAMFYVRSARALGSQALSRALSPCMPLVCRHHPGPSCLPPGSHTSPPASHALPLTRQFASTFNQPLSFDTSSVTTMQAMFQVRSARALGPQPFESRAP